MARPRRGRRSVDACVVTCGRDSSGAPHHEVHPAPCGRPRSALCPGLGAAVRLPVAQPPQAPARVTSADGRAEITDPAGDVKPIVYRVSSRQRSREGGQLPGPRCREARRCRATAAPSPSPPRWPRRRPSAAGEVIEFHVDADNNPKTGVTHPDSKLLGGRGVLRRARGVPRAPVSFGTTCAGTDDTPSGHTARGDAREVRPRLDVQGRAARPAGNGHGEGAEKGADHRPGGAGDGRLRRDRA